MSFIKDAGYELGERIVVNTHSGDAATLDEMKSASRKMNQVEIGVPVNIHRYGCLLIA